MNALIKNLPPLIIAQFTLSSGVKLKSRWPEIGSDTRTPTFFLPVEQSYCACPCPRRAKTRTCSSRPTSLFPRRHLSRVLPPNFEQQKRDTRIFARRHSQHTAKLAARMEMCFFLSLFALHHLVTRCRGNISGHCPRWTRCKLDTRELLCACFFLSPADVDSESLFCRFIWGQPKTLVFLIDMRFSGNKFTPRDTLKI